MPVGTVQLVSMSEYARMRGCSEGAVRRAVRDRRITLTDGKVDPVAADVQWARNTRVRAGSQPTNDANLQLPGATASSQTPAPTADSTGDYWASRARREQAEAELAELKLQETLGALVRRDDVRAALSRRVATFRDGLMQIPSRLASQLAAETSEAAVHALLETELRAAVAHLVDAA